MPEAASVNRDATSTPPDLRLLTPAYDPSKHERYVTLLQRALSDGQACNIALAGNFGTGKSSVLQGLEATFANSKSDLKPITLSLSTLGAAGARNRVGLKTSQVPSAEGQHADVPPITNLIQKEIVKQLLYRQPPSTMTASRYRRAQAFRWKTATGRSVVAGVVAGLIMATLANMGPFNSPEMRILGMALAVGAIVYLAQRYLPSRVSLQQLTAGPATLKLEQAGSYFDEFLDEIVYFFDVTQCRLVIFEDIDRFEDPHIFETLRELNTVLNSSKQLESKTHGPIRFIYAIRDSVFERGAGQPASEGAGQPESPGANRTKFFDLVIPMVPFITHRTARDVMTEALTGTGISAEAVKVVGNHVTDMRLIYNIRNEFEVFRYRILGEDALKGLTIDNLFAMVAYKNLHMRDFERVITGNSRLHLVYDAYREFVNHQITSDEQKIRTRRAKLRAGALTSSQCQQAGERFLKFANAVVASRAGNYPIVNVHVAANTYTPAQVTTRAFWQDALTPGTDVSVGLQYGQGNYVITPAGLELATGHPLDSQVWQSEARAMMGNEIQNALADQESLRRASMADVMKRLEALPEELGQCTLAEYAADRLQSPLAVELLKEGFLDQNFALYVTDYHGGAVSPSALNFVLQVVQRHKPDAHYRFSDLANDIPEVLAEAGDEFLNDARSHNIQLFDYMLGAGHKRVTSAVRSILKSGDAGLMFLDAYLQEGLHNETLVRRLSWLWEEVFEYLATRAALDGLPKERWMNAAILGMDTSMDYTASGPVVETLRELAGQLPVLTASDQADAIPEGFAEAMKGMGVTFLDISNFTPAIADAVVKNACYEVNAVNLKKALGEDAPPSLDSMLDHEPVFEHVLRHLPRYLRILRDEPTTPSVADPLRLAAVLQRLTRDDHEDLTDESIDTILASAAGSISDLTECPVRVWPNLVRRQRCAPTVSNAARFVDEYQHLGDDWTSLLNSVDALDGAEDVDESSKQAVALGLLNVAALPHARRIALVTSLKLADCLPLEKVPPLSIPDLVAADLVTDDADAFNHVPPSMVEARRQLILASANFASYLDDVELTSDDIHGILSSDRPDLHQSILRSADLIASTKVTDRADLIDRALSYSESIPVDALTILAGSGEPVKFMRLLETQIAHLDAAQIRSILSQMPTPYGDIGLSQADVPDSFHRLLLRLKDKGVLSSVRRLPLKSDIRTLP